VGSNLKLEKLWEKNRDNVSEKNYSERNYKYFYQENIIKQFPQEMY
jgi:hypothetical protein